MPANDKHKLIEAFDTSRLDPVAEWEFLFIVIDVDTAKNIFEKLHLL